MRTDRFAEARAQKASFATAGAYNGSTSASATVEVVSEVLKKAAGVYSYADNTITWTVEVNKNSMPMEDAVLTDTLADGLTYAEGSLSVSGGGDTSSATASQASPAAPGESAALPEQCARVAELQKSYPDVVAWISVPGAGADYPVVRGTDNQRYTDTLPDGSKSSAGSIFLDFRTPPDGRRLILYGHNMRNGSMFGSLKNYLKRECLERYPEFFLYTAGEALRCRIFSVARFDAYSADVYTELADAQAVRDFVLSSRETSVYPIETDAEFDRIVTLSTCTGRSGTERLVISAGVVSGD